MSQPANHLNSRQAQHLLLHRPANVCAHTKSTLLSCRLTKKQNVLHALLHPRNAFLSPVVIAVERIAGTRQADVLLQRSSSKEHCISYVEPCFLHSMCLSMAPGRAQRALRSPHNHDFLPHGGAALSTQFAFSSCACRYITAAGSICAQQPHHCVTEWMVLWHPYRDVWKETALQKIQQDGPGPKFAPISRVLQCFHSFRAGSNPANCCLHVGHCQCSFQADWQEVLVWQICSPLSQSKP